MPAFVTRKKLYPGTIFNISMDLSNVWSNLKYMVDKKNFNARSVENCMYLLVKAQRRLEIQLPPDKSLAIWHLYIVRCAKGAYYTGITSNVEKRIEKHNSGRGAKCLKALGLPVVLVYTELVGTYSEALKRERQVKKLSKKQKEELMSHVL